MFFTGFMRSYTYNVSPLVYVVRAREFLRVTDEAFLFQLRIESCQGGWSTCCTVMLWKARGRSMTSWDHGIF
ncbi:hypothetical protein R3I94_009765 [Phoxinus phoxinus]